MMFLCISKPIKKLTSEIVSIGWYKKDNDYGKLNTDYGKLNTDYWEYYQMTRDL